MVKIDGNKFEINSLTFCKWRKEGVGGRGRERSSFGSLNLRWTGTTVINTIGRKVFKVKGTIIYDFFSAVSVAHLLWQL